MRVLLPFPPLVLANFAFLYTVLALPLVENETLEERTAVQQFFRFASLGDSWAAGPASIARDAYGGPSKYDKDCKLHKAAWEPVMVSDTTWTDNPIDFKFAACSGAVLEDVTKQIPKVGGPQLLTMQLGGNSAHFSDIVKACIYVGDLLGPQRDYPDEWGTCYRTIKQWEAYLDADQSVGAQKSFYFDHHLAVQRIMDSDLIKNRDDFYLYIVSYAQFFSTVPDSNWCDDETFAIVKNKEHSPKLSNVLRTKLNQLVSKVNGIIEKSVSDMKNDHIQYLNLDPLYETHRFCEPHHSINNQYFLNDVWFWNISPPEDDPNYLSIQNADAHQSAWANNHTFINGTTATQAQLFTILTGSSNPNASTTSDDASIIRAFHPKEGGHSSTAKSMIDFLRKNKVPGIKPAAPPQPPPKTQPYASGPVHIHIKEYWSCLDDEDNLSVEITMWDSNSNQIGYLPRTQAGASGSAKMGSKLENLLVITPEHANGGYIQFAIGDLQFDTNSDKDETKPVWCRWGGWDPRGGPSCWLPNVIGPPIENAEAVSINQVDCNFPAPDWHGGNPSDGSSL